jgi:hypothetical protein
VTKNILIADYHDARIKQLRGLIEDGLTENGLTENGLTDCKTFVLKTGSYEPKRDTDTAKLAEIAIRKYDLLIAHTGGNPSGAECLQKYKRTNPSGRAILYTNRDSIRLEEFEEYKQANKLIRRSANDDIMFDNSHEMLAIHQFRQNVVDVTNRGVSQGICSWRILGTHYERHHGNCGQPQRGT